MNKSLQQNILGWLFVRVSGVLVLFLALGHLYIMHVANSVDSIDAQFVIQRLNNPLWKTYDFLLLTLALAHGGYGIKNILDDILRKTWHGPMKALLGLICGALFLIGLVVFVKNLNG